MHKGDSDDDDDNSNNNTRGSQKIRFPILLPPNNFT
jgi:hypothetical protein